MVGIYKAADLKDSEPHNLFLQDFYWREAKIENNSFFFFFFFCSFWGLSDVWNTTFQNVIYI